MHCFGKFANSESEIPVGRGMLVPSFLVALLFSGHMESTSLPREMIILSLKSPAPPAACHHLGWLAATLPPG